MKKDKIWYLSGNTVFFVVMYEDVSVCHCAATKYSYVPLNDINTF